MMIVREIVQEDIENAVKLWVEVFGDSEPFVRKFFECLPEIGTCVIGEEAGQLVAMASVIDDLSIQAEQTAYIYAVAVDEGFRKKGYGVEISKEAFLKARERGAKIITTLPASDSLYDFYESALNMKTALRRQKNTVSAANTETVTEISGRDYFVKREKLLCNENYLSVGQPAMNFYAQLCKEYGGGLYSTPTGIFSAQISDNRCIIYEIIAKNPEKTAAAAAYFLNADSTEYYIHSEFGDRFIMADCEAEIDAKCVFNIAFE